jgi:hypothetical protein
MSSWQETKTTVLMTAIDSLEYVFSSYTAVDIHEILLAIDTFETCGQCWYHYLQQGCRLVLG